MNYEITQGESTKLLKSGLSLPDSSEEARQLLMAPRTENLDHILADELLFLRERATDDRLSLALQKENAAWDPQEGRFDGYSGYVLKRDGWEFGRIQFSAKIFSGFIVRRSVYGANGWTVRHDHYSDEGVLYLAQEELAGDPLFVDLDSMDPGCPVASHLYNILAYEYDEAKSGRANSKRILLVENVLRTLYQTTPSPLSVRKFGFDPVMAGTHYRVLANEKDPVLTWEERRTLRRQALEEQARALSTKRRTHRLSFFSHRISATGFRLWNGLCRLKIRPRNNLAGFSYRYTIGVAIWFFKTVRNNVGYSMALAIYGPFTYFFITQPMNPHAMWAVGKVRTFYLDAKKTVIPTNEGFGAPWSPSVPVNVSPVAPLTLTATTAAVTPSPTANRNYDKTAFINSILPIEGILLTSQSSDQTEYSWSDRMSNFKDMQIGYEEGMEFAPRTGRLEQLESQINYPLITESSYREMERYLQDLNKLEEYVAAAPLIPAATGLALKDFIFQEKSRTYQHELYLWDRTYQFILDHPYILSDISNEQTYVDAYQGRAFVLFREMTEKLTRQYRHLQKPEGFIKLDKLAAQFEKLRKDEEADFFTRLKSNSRIFTQKDPYSTKEYRSYMKRQWEVLYLLHSRAQEASNFGLQLYTWSVRNTIWSLQSIYSAKRQELEYYRERLQHPKDARRFSTILAAKVKDLDPLYENIYHGLFMEFVGIRQEISDRLSRDIESIQRQTVLANLDAFFKQRETLWKTLH